MIRTVAAFFFVGLVTSAQARAGGLPEAIVVPANGSPAGCALRAAKSNAGVTLEIAPGVPYARVAQAQSIEVALPVGREAPAAGVSLTVGSVRLKGLATPPGLALYAARPFVVGEMLVPGPHSRLRWGEVAANRVAVEIDLAKEMRSEVRDVKGPLRAWRPCADLRLTSPGGFDSYDAFGGRGTDLAAGLRQSSPVPIAAQPNGPPLAKLVVNRKKAALNEVTVIDEDQAGWSRIARPTTGDLLVVGWVKQGRLGKPPARDTTFAAFGAGMPKAVAAGAAAPTDAAAAFACPKEIPLVAEAGGLRKVVGAIGPGVHLRTAAADAELVAVQFPDGAAAAVMPLKGARLLARRADVAGCPGFSAP
jgi:hypothetical protein